MDATNGSCVLCNKDLQNGIPAVQLRVKGCDGINKASTERETDIVTVPGQYVHVQCRRDYCNPNTIKRDRKTTTATSYNITSPRTLRSTWGSFSFKRHCLFCGQIAKTDGKKRSLDVHRVRAFTFDYNIEQTCTDRADEWGNDVLCRIKSVHDFHAEEARYHQCCSVNFRTGKGIPDEYAPEYGIASKRARGRATDYEKAQAFTSVASYLEKSDDEQITVTDLIDKMVELGDEGCEYSVTHMKRKLKEHFGESIIITEINGKKSVVTLRSTAGSILHDFYHRQKCLDNESEKDAILKTAAKLIKSDIKSMDSTMDSYINPSELASVEQNYAYLPESVRLLLRTAFSEKHADVKTASIGQAIIQAVRPRTIIAPLQLGLAVQLHHHFASKFLIETLNNLGFCVSYTEVQKFESCAAVSQKTDIPGFIPGSFVQYVADNVDHNIRTLDGHGTFHGMGIIACVTPATQNHAPISRDSVTKDNIIDAANIKISYYNPNESTKIHLSFEELNDIRATDKTWKLDFLVKVSRPLRPVSPSWSGEMQLLQVGDSPGKSSVMFMPMIDMSPSDMSCIYTTLKFVSDNAAKYGVNPVITFDQPLYWKALTVILNENTDSRLRDVVLRLGGFHTIISFLGCVGQLMQGSGLSELLETVYASNAVGHMISGKAVARAVRGHLLVDNALNSILVSQMFGVSLHTADQGDSIPCDIIDDTLNTADLIGPCVPSNQNDECENDNPTERNVAKANDDISELSTTFDDLISGKIDVQSISENELLEKVSESFAEGKNSMKTSRTASLWLHGSAKLFGNIHLQPCYMLVKCY